MSIAIYSAIKNFFKKKKTSKYFATLPFYIKLWHDTFYSELRSKFKHSYYRKY